MAGRRGTEKKKPVKSDGVCSLGDNHDGKFFWSPTVGADVVLVGLYRKSGLMQWAHLVQSTNLRTQLSICKMHYYFYYLFLFIIIWELFLLTAE